jgi:hypothetical protein
MCEDCENPSAPHLTYAAKRKRISAVWQPARRAGKPFVVETVASGSAPADAEPAPQRTD